MTLVTSDEFVLILLDFGVKLKVEKQFIETNSDCLDFSKACTYTFKIFISLIEES